MIDNKVVGLSVPTPLQPQTVLEPRRGTTSDGEMHECAGGTFN